MKIKKTIKRIFLGLALIYSALCAFIYFFQEKLIFFPEKVELSYTYEFDQTFDEYNLAMADGVNLNLLHFKADNSRGAILHFHGNAGSIMSWGSHAAVYLALGYDFFIYDYRGFGKSEGNISSEEQLISDAEQVFQFVETFYPTDKISIEGFSIGTGIAAQTASKHAVNRLLLLAPYERLSAVMRAKYPLLPSFLLKYQLNSAHYISVIKAPITIFHGIEDEVIPVENAKKLALKFKPTDELILVENKHHSDLPSCTEYLTYLQTLLRP